MTVKFRVCRDRAISCLLNGCYQHEPRKSFVGKNLLATGDVSVAEVVELLRRCRGDQHQVSPYHFDPTLDVHVFEPVRLGTRWYIKLYFPGEEPDAAQEDLTMIISVHT